LEAASGPDADDVAWTAIEDAPTVLCSPTVSDGTVFVGSAANAVHAFDAESGDLKWEHATRSYVSTAPAVVGDTVYTADADGIVYALDVTDGTDRWTYNTEHNFHSRAVGLHGDTLIVGTAGTMPAVVSGDTDKSRAGVVVGLDIATGEELWTFSGPSDWFSGPAIGDGRVYVGNHDGTVTALDPANGDLLWQWTPVRGGQGAILAPPTYAGGTVYVGVHGLGRLVALEATDGSQRWNTNLKAPNVKSSPAVDGDRVYIGATGSESNDYDGPDEPTPTPTPTPEPTPTPNEEGVIVKPAPMPTIKTSGSVFALSTADGSIEWRHETEHDFRSSPAVLKDRVYIGGGERFLALSRADGSERWSVTLFDDSLSPALYSSPAISGERAYIGSPDGRLYCIGKPS